MASNDHSVDNNEVTVLQMILCMRYFETVLSSVILIILITAAYPVQANVLLWIASFTGVAGSLFVVLLSWVLFGPISVPMLDMLSTPLGNGITVAYVYDLLMTLIAAVCVPLSVYCISYVPEGGLRAVTYIIIAVCFAFLATCFMTSVLLHHDFEYDDLRERINEHIPLLHERAESDSYQAL